MCRMYCFLCIILIMGTTEINLVQTGSENKESNSTFPTARSTSVSNGSAPTFSHKDLNNHISQTSDQTSSTKTPTTITCSKTTNNFSLSIEDLKKTLPLIVTGALGIACFTLLLTTLILACKVCCLNRRVSISYQVCNDTVNCEPSETVLMMNEISNAKPEGDVIQAEPAEPAKQEEVMQDVPQAEVTDQASAEAFTQNGMPTAELPPPIQDCEISGEDAAVSELP